MLYAMRPNLSVMKGAALALCWSGAFLPRACHACEPAPRQPGPTLSISIRNEMVYAMQQAVEWLTARQLPSGGWGATNRPDYRLTALTRFALQAIRQPQSAKACRRASGWLAKNIPPRPTALDACAWHLLGDAAEAADRGHKIFRETAQAVRRAAEPIEAEASPEERAFWREALAAAGLPAASVAGKPIPPDPLREPVWPPAADAPIRELWQTARLINRRNRGILQPEGREPLNWQRELATRLICAQRRDLSGGGAYWPAAGNGSPALEQTAFALLVFLEL